MTGLKTYNITQPAQNGGAACPFSQGQTDSSGCAVAVNCAGSWGACNQACGGGSQVFTVYVPAQNGGADCSAANGQSQACNTQPCAPTSGKWKYVKGWTCAKPPYANPTWLNEFGQVIPAPPPGNCPDPFGIGLKGAFIEGTSCSPVGSYCLDDCGGTGFDVQQKWRCQ